VREHVQQWIKEHGDIPPTASQKNDLQEELHISRTQLNRLIQRLRTQRKPSQSAGISLVSGETKKFMANWLRENNFELPTDEQRTSLMNETGLTKSQVGRLARNERNKMPLHMVQQKGNQM